MWRRLKRGAPKPRGLAVVVVGSKRAYYGLFVHGGYGKGNRPRPFLTEALDQVQPRLLQIGKRAMVAGFRELQATLRR